MTSAANLLPSWSLGVLDGIGEKVREDEDSIETEFLQGRPRSCFGDVVGTSMVALRELQRGIMEIFKVIN